MASPAAALSCSFLLLLSVAADAANNIDINNILNAYPDFSAFSKLLAQTGVANGINQQPSSTVLVVDNAHMSELSRQPPDAAVKTLSLHVVLEYYDEAKLKKMHFRNPLLLTTLYQQISGKAQNLQGFLKMKSEGNGSVAFGSAAPGSNLDTTFVKQITTQPDRVSVLQVSNIINGTRTTASASPASRTTASSSPASLTTASAPRKALAPATGPSLKGSPALSPTTASPSKLPVASAPAPSDASVGYGGYLASTILLISLGLCLFFL